MNGDGQNRMIRPSSIGAVVVHHRSYSTLSATVRSLLEQGVPFHAVVVVDNSEEDRRLVKAVVPDGVRTIYTSNSGYAAAANVGIDALLKGAVVTGIIVCTHEAISEPGAIGSLCSVLDRDTSIGAVGPVLLNRDNRNKIWSAGGSLTPTLKLPRHREFGALSQSFTRGGVALCDWLDGAFVLYRAEVFEQNRLPEFYFLYLEEVDFHTQLKRCGFKIACDNDAVVLQSSMGSPGYFALRNLIVFHRRFWPTRRFLRFAAVACELARRSIRSLARPGDSESNGWLALLRGAWHGTRLRVPAYERSSCTSIGVVNPLGCALGHYADALIDNLSTSGADICLYRISEPAFSRYGPGGWVLRTAGCILISHLSGNELTIVLWPTLGYYDLILVRLLGKRAPWYIVHDPIPIADKAVGYGKLARLFARTVKVSRTIVHSEVAARELARVLSREPGHLLPHPR